MSLLISDYEQSIFEKTREEATNAGYQLTVTTRCYRLWDGDGVKMFPKLVDIRAFIRQEKKETKQIKEQVPLI